MMTLRVSSLIPKGHAVLERRGEAVAFGSLEDMCANYRPEFTLVVSPDTDEALRAACAKDVTPKQWLAPTDKCGHGIPMFYGCSECGRHGN